MQQIGGDGDLRQTSNGDGLAITSHGSLVLDMTFDSSLAADELNAELNTIPGIVEHGIFHLLSNRYICGESG